ncbi:MAG: amidohydrolase [Alphaproteobacteria bacterium]|nr:amidohydrolase [Alphaproteobacteria bacterium]
MFIVDAQVHIWGANTAERPWPTGRSAPHRARPFSKDDLLREMEAAEVARVVIVPPSWEGDRNDLALEAACLHPDRFAVMGRPPQEPSPLGDWRDQPGMLGLRITSNTAEARAFFADPDAWVWNEAERAGLPVMVSPSGLLPEIDRIAQLHPQLKLVIDHLALLRAKDNAAFDDLPKLLRLARLPNVAAKASALPAYTSHDYPYYNLHPYLCRVFDAFGPRRMFWGTDLTRLPCTYRQAITLFTEELPWLSPEDQEWVMGRGICEWLGWPF